MASDDYVNAVAQTLISLYNIDMLPVSHQQFLEKIKKENNFVPKVIYDIGSCVLHWTRHAERIWPESKIILFEAFGPAILFYDKYTYSMNVLSDVDNKEIKFYQNDFHPGGCSYYREIGSPHSAAIYPENSYVVKKTRSLDSLVLENNYPLPDLIKIDVQGAELDILKGATKTLENVKYLIIELQQIQYNEGAPLVNVTKKYLEDNGWLCIAEKFSENRYDADYCFINLRNFRIL